MPPIHLSHWSRIPGPLQFAKPEREKSTSRIDGISAITNAMARAMLAPEEEQSAKIEVW